MMSGGQSTVVAFVSLLEHVRGEMEREVEREGEGEGEREGEREGEKIVPPEKRLAAGGVLGGLVEEVAADIQDLLLTAHSLIGEGPCEPLHDIVAVYVYL